MYQIDVPTAVPAQPAPTAPGTAGWFTDGNVVTNVPPTIVPAEWLNAVMAEMLNVMAAGGVVPAKTSSNQLQLAIENLIEARSGNYALDTGVANAYVVALNPPLTANVAGMTIKFRAIHANTNACTLDAGAGATPLVRDDGTPLQPGDIPANGIVTVTFDQAAGAYLANSIVLSQIGPLAKLGIGAGLVNDGAGNLAADLQTQHSDLYFYSQS